MPSIESPNLQASKDTKSAVIKQVSSQLLKVFGDSGTPRYGGYIQAEYNTEWQDDRRAELIEKMRRGDASIRSALRAIKAPMLATDWNIVTDGTDPQDEKIRAFVEDCLFNMRRTWKEFLREALGYLDFGHYCFELIWEKRDGRVVLADLAPRIPRSILKWKLDDGTFGIVQLLETDEAPVLNAEIPAWKLLILTNDKEGDDVTGQSVLRAAYKHYVYKEMMYKIQSIACERYGVGVPVIKPGEAAGEQDKADAEEMGRNLRSHEEAFIVLPNNNWELDIKTPGANGTHALLEQGIQHHSKQIMLSVLATFLALGTDGTGSYALSQDQSSFFLKCVEDMAFYFTEQINNQVIRRLVDLNFNQPKNYPYLKFSTLGDIDYQELAGVLSSLSSSGLIKMNAKMMQYIHREFRLPEITDADMEMMEEQEIEQGLAALEQEDSSGMNLPEEDQAGQAADAADQTEGNAPEAAPQA